MCYADTGHVEEIQLPFIWHIQGSTILLTGVQTLALTICSYLTLYTLIRQIGWKNEPFYLV
jgi:hypothetical protein